MTAPAFSSSTVQSQHPYPLEHGENLKVQISALLVLIEQLPVVNALMEDSMVGLSKEFSGLAEMFQQRCKQIEALAAQAEAEGNSLAKELSEIVKDLKSVPGGINNQMIHMQFQDRVSQNLVIAIHVLQGVISYLQHFLDAGAAEDKIAFIKQLFEQFKLGELQQAFLRTLIEHEHITDPAVLNIQHRSDPVQDIELF